MKGDFSRHTFDRTRHFSSVRLQQGRVQVDADWNEQVDLARHRLETGTLDQVGHCGGPLHDAGFRVVPLLGAPQPIKDAVKDAYPGLDVDKTDDLVILPGRYYVFGTLVVCEAPVLFGSQPDLPHPLPWTPPTPAHGLQDGDYVLYLDVFDRHLTALEEPSIRERALGGPDTATRTRTVWQVGALPYQAVEGPVCDAPPEWEQAIADPERELSARGQPAGPDQGPCVVPAGAGYRGLENQLYRVEVHQPGAADAGGAGVAVTVFDPQQANVVTVDAAGWQVGQWVLLYPTQAGGLLVPTLAQVSAIAGAGKKLTLTTDVRLSVTDDKPRVRAIGGATFKWSRDNGIAVTRATGLSNDGLRVTVDSLGQDEVLGFRKGDWVELTDDFTELRGLPGWMAVVDELDTAAREVVLRTPIPLLAANQLDFDHRTTRLRRWDGLGVVPAAANPPTYQPLEDGVEVAFGGGPFRTGDWWVIPARAATAENEQGGNVEWPVDAAGTSIPRPPMGIRHHYCRIGTVHVSAAQAPSVSDCRCLFPPLTEIRSLVYVSGAGQEAMPDFSDATAKPELALPLIVGVGNGHCRTDGRVRFAVESGDGEVTSVPGSYVGSPVTVVVDLASDGTASCWWSLGRADYAQTVSATLQERVYQHPGDPTQDIWIDVPGPIVFNASLSIASQVGYQPESACVPMSHQYTVQDAITHLSRLQTLHVIGGDGQEARPWHELPCQLSVLVSSACGPVQGARVQFGVGGGGSLQGVDGNGVATTGGSGVATVRWTLGSSGCQQVSAVLQGNSDFVSHPQKVVFTATLSTADQVEYDPASNCAMAAASPRVETVQQALDWLCAHRGGGCEVTVGPGGDFPRLIDALKELPQRVGMCICLLPGMHLVEGPEEAFDFPGCSLCIRACGGPGSGLLLRGRSLRLHGLESLILRDLDLVADKVEKPLLFTGCEEVLIENCRIGQSDFGTTLLTVGTASRLRVQGCTLWSMHGGDSEGLDQEVRDKPMNVLRRVTEPGPTFAGLAPIGTVTAAPASTGRASTGAASTGSALSFATVFNMLAADRFSAFERPARPKRTGRATRPAGTTEFALRGWFPANVLALLDCDGMVVLEDNLLIGHVQVGGDGDPLPWEEADQSGVAIPGGNLVVGLRGGTLELRGNQLLGLRVDKTALNNRTPPPQREKAETLEGTFRFCTLTDNRFALPGSVVFAANLRVASNQFEYPDDPPGHLLALVGLTRSATAVGNVVGQVRLADPDTGEIPLINIYVSNGRGREAANVPRVRIV